MLVFPRVLLHNSANHRFGWYWNRVSKQREGIVDGPGQVSLDLAISKTLNWPVGGSSLQFRGEF